MQAVFSTIQVIICVILVLLILMHSGKDSGLSGAFGVGTGTGPLGGGSLVERNLNRWTIFFALLFVANTILLLKHPWGGSGNPGPPSPRRWQAADPSKREATCGPPTRRSSGSLRYAEQVDDEDQ